MIQAMSQERRQMKGLIFHQQPTNINDSIETMTNEDQRSVIVPNNYSKKQAAEQNNLHRSRVNLASPEQNKLAFSSNQKYRNKKHKDGELTLC